MKLMIFDDMAQCTQQEVERLLPLVSAQRREQALKFKFLFGQFACLKAYEMLTELLGRVGDRSLTFRFNEHGKPFIDGERYFSISHCKQGIAVAVDDKPIGIDIESVREADEALIEKTMNLDEAKAIRSSANPKEAFISFWTKKEAVLKLRGTGIIDELHDVLSADETVETFINHEKEYVYSIAR